MLCPCVAGPTGCGWLRVLHWGDARHGSKLHHLAPPPTNPSLPRAGVEFAGTLSDFLREDLKKKYPELMPYVKVTLLNSAQTILTQFDGRCASAGGSVLTWRVGRFAGSCTGCGAQRGVLHSVLRGVTPTTWACGLFHSLCRAQDAAARD